ncbi:DUF86 domain-containing protein [Candidatus Chloroploca sp. M-50]|uniref:DUF86 domain-containing protein n=1 Tax=Candidatus Chloroploca mongolica TaxID=2528176 RepID=A0ABS4D9Z8_9CHLR|nr:DUF86 domain-containing protein [Candidatus Chloroploca mongolica]MBP1466235.1 DUF86 domain-containing protein [Candidatus Chloroploca mongolica]
MKDDGLYLTHMLECITQIEEYTRNGKEAFMASRMTQDAVVRNFEIIGEATKRVSPSLKDAHPHVPWRRIAGLRDVLIHDYIRVELEQVWALVIGPMRDLKRDLTTIRAILEGA